MVADGEAEQSVGLKWAAVLQPSQAGSPPRLPLSSALRPGQEPAVETQPSADTEEETLRRRLEELTSNISGSGTSSEDETKPASTSPGGPPKVRSPLRSKAKHRAKGTILVTIYPRREGS